MNFSVFLVSFFTWMVLTWSLDPQELAIGLLVSFVVSVVFKRYYKITLDAKFPVRFLRFVFVYVPVFMWEMIKANLDVGSRVIMPDMGLKPGFVKVRTDLKSEVGKLVLANSITLTPGTITLDIDGQELHVHWIEVSGTDESSKKAIYGRFEKVLKGVFE
ncbi:Na+/H+ antiporter subunit E [Fervidobacterium thailandense]|uniref:Cation:proton antiporter n=1 Tax=Fervidobacterium thailandense TaxID=1008305 RepID=A0A1E3G2Y8_9BACT|nr:Na+/H+ antiporter subunit E [Fervidobacterium thailandense]ODN30656.1 cation:proton antiporter [Fervidobacterium thailandense]